MMNVFTVAMYLLLEFQIRVQVRIELDNMITINSKLTEPQLDLWNDSFRSHKYAKGNLFYECRATYGFSYLI